MQLHLASWRARLAALSRPERVRAAIVIAALLALGGGLWLRAVSLRPEVKPAVAAFGTAAEIVYATGAVEPVRWAKVTSLIRDRIVDICYCEGKTIAKGDVLVRLDNREQQALLDELRAREGFAKREVERVTQLLERGNVSVQAFERASTELSQIQALISVQVEKIADYTIVAPMDGIVLRRDGEVGEIAEPGEILFRVGVPKPLEVVAEVNEEDIPRVSVGQSVLLRTDAFRGRELKGRVRQVTPMGDPVTKTYRIRVALPDDTPLLAGMSVEANVVTREKQNALLVPADAVEGSTVYRLEGTRVRRHPVEVGIRGTGRVEILSGLEAGDRVASPAIGLKDGARVRLIEADPGAP